MSEPHEKAGAAPPASAPNVHAKPFWSFRPRSDRESGDAVVSNFALHWFPAKVSKASLDWNYSFWLGTVSAALLLLLVLSGMPLLFLYVPSVERAYATVKDIEHVVSFGSWIRAVHRLSAHLMVAAVFLHLVRVFLTGAYKNGVGRGQHREWNWVLGVVMLVLTLFLSFTGYLLPWDQLAYWAVTVGTNIASSVPLVGESMRELLLGGREIEQPTLIRFYVLHVIALPGFLGILFVYHMWRVRKDGGLARADREGLLDEAAPVPAGPTKTYTLLGVARGTAPAIRARSVEAPETTVNAVPDLVRRAAIVVLGTFAVVGILAVLDPLAAGGAGQPAGHPQPGQGALVLPLAAGDRHRHHAPRRLVHHQRGAHRRRHPAGPAGRADDLLAVARPQRARRRRALVPEEPPHPEPGLPAALPGDRAAHHPRHLHAGTVLALFWPWEAVAGDSPRGSEHGKAQTNSPYPQRRPARAGGIGLALVVGHRALRLRNDREHDWR